jgi:hypothetical protein
MTHEVDPPAAWPFPSGMAAAMDDLPVIDPKHDADARKALLMTLVAASTRELAYPDSDNVDAIKRAASAL